jgi:hypothetical protein
VFSCCQQAVGFVQFYKTIGEQWGGYGSLVLVLQLGIKF